MLRSYARLILFSLGLLAGLQIPNFVQQYTQRVNAHQIESENDFRGFQETADRYFGGSVDALIAHHAASADRVFRDEARTIAAIYARVKMWRREWAALQSSLPARIAHIVFNANAQIRRETLDAYTYDVPLTPAATACGMVIAISGALIFEGLVFGLFGALFSKVRAPRRASNLR